ncbi:hypothetical protein NPIL_663181 [Nephila pilipes]|uniref:Uncharacterized protein n=1 Tax=Nephila pilipes TaxID=299642 RepID=A0A8X6QBP1_NEPPI|nr:hypothetical protein NPIL_663181 [Nephila pilipes]
MGSPLGTRKQRGGRPVPGYELSYATRKLFMIRTIPGLASLKGFQSSTEFCSNVCVRFSQTTHSYRRCTYPVFVPDPEKGEGQKRERRECIFVPNSQGT